MKNILLHLQHSAGSDRARENAIALATSLEAHLTCMYVTPNSAFVAAGPFGGIFAIDDIMDALEKRATDVKGKVEADLANEAIGWDYDRRVGDPVATLAYHSSISDLLITGRDEAKDDDLQTPMARLGSLLHRVHCPIFIPGDDGAVIDPNGTAIIAWDGSVESANAVRACLPVLKTASKVKVVRIEEDKDQFPDTRVMEYLSRHGIHAELIVEPFTEKWVDEVLVLHAQTSHPSFIVSGAYSHRRLSEFLFGGTTRSLLRKCPVGLFLAH
ncbi:universal stress protein [Sphingomicrobium sediminis]|uniref:Universal stress protein n=1 Tax=Sphingomicrobium sediminis TaxID=2950949 RepID=A0A9X2J196_9SPHN|nr:universal stress protein [Sphingomicrobium sediminis]MCM8556494.1 universal stress protein [Sphingomicrobium sediminis]